MPALSQAQVRAIASRGDANNNLIFCACTQAQASGVGVDGSLTHLLYPRE